MIDLFIELFSKLGFPSIVILIITIILKSRPITLLSASPLEQKLFTKEKRFYAKSIKVVFEVICYLLFSLVITEEFFYKKELYSPAIAWISFLVLIAVLIWILLMDLKEKDFMLLFKEKLKSKKKLIPLYLLFLLYLLAWFILLSYYIGTQIYSDFHNDNLPASQRITVLIIVIIIYLIIIVSIYFPIIKTIYRFLGFGKTSKYLKVELDGKEWYLHHPIEDNLILLGDYPILSQCTEFFFIEKSKLLTKSITIEDEKSESSGGSPS